MLTFLSSIVLAVGSLSAPAAPAADCCKPCCSSPCCSACSANGCTDCASCSCDACACCGK